MLEQEDDDDELPDISLTPINTYDKSAKKLKKYKLLENDDDEDSLLIKSKRNSETRSNPKARGKNRVISYSAHCSKDDDDNEDEEEENDDEYLPSLNKSYNKKKTYSRKQNNKYCEDEYDMNDSFIDDDTENDPAVSRKRAKHKKHDDTSSSENESIESFKSDDDYLAQHRAVLEKQKKTQGYNTDNIGEDLAIKNELNRNEQVANSENLSNQLEQKYNPNQELTVSVDPNNPTLPSEPIEDEGEEISPIETYVVYKPKKLTIGKVHPDVVVETVKIYALNKFSNFLMKMRFRYFFFKS